MKKLAAVILAAALAALCCACGGQTPAQNGTPAVSAEPITLTVCGGWEDCPALADAAQAFLAQYPNCTVEYEFLQNYDESLLTRLENSPESVDLFLSSSIQSDSPLFPYAQELFSLDNVDLSQTNDALIKNFTLKTTNPNAPAEIYAIPMGGELRGMYVNKTLLASLGLAVPTNVQELLEACEVLKEAGYIPMNGNPGMFSQRLLYPYVCNLIANADDYQAVYDSVNRCEPGVSELFRQPMQLMYTLMEKGYYNYKYVETELNRFTDNSDENIAKDFLGIAADESAPEVGEVAFMSGTLSQATTMQKVWKDYHSKIDYEFVLAPVSEEGGFAYISPGHAIAVNKNSAHPEMAAEFLSFLFQKEENARFAQGLNLIPNTKDSFDAVHQMFDIPENRISDLGQATFDYDFYSIAANELLVISKGNNPKYMDTDKNGSLTLYSFDYYMQQLDDAFAAQSEAMK